MVGEANVFIILLPLTSIMLKVWNRMLPPMKSCDAIQRYMVSPFQIGPILRLFA